MKFFCWLLVFLTVQQHYFLWGEKAEKQRDREGELWKIKECNMHYEIVDGHHLTNPNLVTEFRVTSSRLYKTSLNLFMSSSALTSSTFHFFNVQNQDLGHASKFKVIRKVSLWIWIYAPLSRVTWRNGNFCHLYPNHRSEN